MALVTERTTEQRFSRQVITSRQSLGIRLEWSLTLGAVLLSLSLAAAATFWRAHSERRQLRAVSSVDALQSTQQRDPAQPMPAPTREVDFTSSLPASASIDPILRDLQRFSVSAGIIFVSVDASARDATGRTLGRIEIAVTLRGEYAQLKSVLAQALDRYPHLVLQRLSLRRLAAPADVEATVNLLMLSKPKPATGSGS